LIDGRASASSSLDSARQNLAATFVNAFVNAGFGQVIFKKNILNYGTLFKLINYFYLNFFYLCLYRIN
jgi:hypothetical protein